MNGIGAAGAVFEITPHDTTFAQPVTVRIPFDATQVPADALPKLYKAELNGAFTEIPTTVDGNVLVADGSHNQIEDQFRNPERCKREEGRYRTESQSADR